MKNRLLILPSTILCFLVIVLSMVASSFVSVSPKVSAAVPSDATLLNQGKATAECKDRQASTAGSTAQKTNALNICAQAYVNGYKAGGNVDRNSTVDKCRAFPTTNLADCAVGYEKGQTDRKAADAAATNPPSTNTGSLTTAAITELGKTNTACASLRGSSNDPSANANFGECVNGYVDGYQGKTIAQACGSSALKASCEKGFAAGQADKGANVTTAAQQTAASGAAASASGANPDDLQLDCNAGFNPLNWLVCGAVKGMVAVLKGVDGAINSLLSIGTPDETRSGDPVNIFDTSQESGKAYHTAWASFRNIALGLLLIAGLVMIMAQAIGMEILDAYTVRKILPRLLIVALAITISWPGLRFLVELFNDLGYGVRYLIQSPFTTQLDNTIKLAGGQGTAVLLATPVAFLALGVFGLFTFVGTALLAAFIAFLVLVIRQIVVVVLVIVAPIALVLYILPNTQKYWQLWQNSLFGALMMFPIISAVIAAGRVFAAVANNGGGVNETLDSFLAFAAYFAPYFLIPATFKFAGGAVRSIGGFVNDRGRGSFDRLRKARQESIGNRVKRARSGGIYRPDFGQFGRPDAAGERKSVGKYLNKFGDWTLDADERARVGLGTVGGRGVPGFRRGARAMISQIEDAKIKHALKATQEADEDYKTGWATAGMFDKFTGSLDGGQTNGAARQRLDRDFGTAFDSETGMATAWRAPRGLNEFNEVSDILSTGNEAAREASEGLRTKAPYLSDLALTGDETRRADSRLVGLMSAAKAGRLENDDIITNHNKLLATGNREQAMRETAILQDMSAPKRASLARGHAIEFTPDGTARSVYRNPTSAKAQASILRLNQQEVAASKSEDLDGLVGEAWVAGASNHDMVFNRNTGQMDLHRDATGRILDAPKSADTSPEGIVRAARAQEVQGRLRTIAMYNSGDSEVGRKVKVIWNRAGLDLAELDFGSRVGQTPPPADMVGLGTPPPAPPPPGSPPPPGG